MKLLLAGNGRDYVENWGGTHDLQFYRHFNATLNDSLAAMTGNFDANFRRSVRRF
ncbi:MAG: hypothetical protein IPN76_12635 [Saprospiraceae bacterium]|nr:hypothetical protein [Saprospiraceae bacterium]